MLVNVNKLRGKIVENELNVATLAEKIGVDATTLYRRISDGGETFLIKEVQAIARELNLTIDEINSIFFADYVA